MADEKFPPNDVTLFISEYLYMEIGGTLINCPYWANKLKNGIVWIRGYANGKGTAAEIRTELQKRFTGLGQGTPPTAEVLSKFARREKIGIDCSGFVYRVLEFLYRKNHPDSLNSIFKGGINKTNADMLTSAPFVIPVTDAVQASIGDLLRMSGGRHIAIVSSRDGNKITYAHSSHLSYIQGVHQAQIVISKKGESIEKQNWTEKTGLGENFAEKYFNTAQGDGLFRLKIFANG